MVEEAEAASQAQEVKKIKDDADGELNRVLPALDDAIKKVRGIDVNSFYELKNIAAPSKSVVSMFKVVAIMLKMKKPPKQTN
jgi:hypothetical protein